MKSIKTVMIAAVLAASSAAWAGIDVAEVGSFYVGGGNVTLNHLPVKEIAINPGAVPMKTESSGDFEAGQMYTQFVKLEHPRKLPILFWHGGGLTGVTWETTPDGRPGWQMFFLRAGFDAYVSDSVERGRASWARYPEIYPGEPIFRSKKEAWEAFRIGPAGSYDTDPAKRTPYKDTQFPVQAFDTFIKQSVPRWLGNDALMQKGYDQLVQKVCPCIVIAHSQGVRYAQRAAQNAPGKIAAMVYLDGPNAPDPAHDDPKIVAGIPQLWVFSDHQAGIPFWMSFKKSQRDWYDAVSRSNPRARWVELPEIGINGNSHMMMMDRNSDQVAQLVLDWLRKVGVGD